ncbi:MAG: signal peptidase I [Clostridia bacterium]|nr:signal peptidase I [Clostridia bacterium]
MRKQENYSVTFNTEEVIPTNTKKGIWDFIYGWLDSLVFAIMLILVVFVFAFRIVGVIGDSMNPTLQSGEWLAVKAINTSINRGDIVIVTQPNDLNEPLVKRVIAVGGDTLDIDFKRGQVKVNNEILDEPYIAELTNRRGDFTGPITIPEGYVFVMGDNRNDSLDSRFNSVGLIDERYVLGVAEFRFYPFDTLEINSDEK